jgi:hypothetical protein
VCREWPKESRMGRIGTLGELRLECSAWWTWVVLVMVTGSPFPAGNFGAASLFESILLVLLFVGLVHAWLGERHTEIVHVVCNVCPL